MRYRALAVFVCGLFACGAGRKVAPLACSGADAVVREDAVVRALQWLGRFFAQPARVQAMRMDATTIFREVGETASSPRVSALAMPTALRLAQQTYREYLKPAGLDQSSELTDAAWLLADADVFGLSAEPLHTRIRARLAEFTSRRAMYGVDVEHLDTLSEEDLFNVLMKTYKLEKLSARFDDIRPPLPLAEVLAFIWQKPLVSHDDKDSGLFSDHAYLATHVAYVLDDFSRFALQRETPGPIFDYLRREFPGVLAQQDLELVSEFVDVFRSIGFDDSDPMVCAGSRFILKKQRRDGAFSDWQNEQSPYDAVHPTWAALGGLRDRCVLRDVWYPRLTHEVAARLRVGSARAAPFVQGPPRLPTVCPAK